MGYRTAIAALLVLLAGAGGAVPAAAAPATDATPRVPQSRAEITLSFAPLVKKAAPAVVNIYTRRVIKTRAISPLFDDPFFRRFFGGQLPGGGVQKRIQNSLGSGVIVRPDGLIVTNYHVIKKADQITVVLSDRREFDAKVVGRDKQLDLAVLRIDTKGEKLPYLKFRDSDTVEVGDLVLAIGNPFGVGQTVTSGIISALSRTAKGVSDYSFFIQTDAAINPGNSGGALITVDGRLVGLNSAIYSRDGGSNGIGFAIPSNMVRSVVESVETGGKIVRPWFGAQGQTVDSDVAKSLGLDRPAGVLINSVHAGGPAARAGLRVGDVVLSIDGRDVFDATSLRFRIATLHVGDKADLDVLRGGHRLKVDVRLVAPPETPPRDTTTVGGQNPYTGARIANLSPALAQQLSLDMNETGVIVLHVEPGTPSDQVGLEQGDILLGLNGHKVTSVARLKRLLAAAQGRWHVTIRRNGQVLQMNLRG